MSMWSMRFPDGPPMPQTFGSRIDAADQARKDAKCWPPDDHDPGDEHAERAACPNCGRETLMLATFGECPYADCRHGRSPA